MVVLLQEFYKMHLVHLPKKALIKIRYSLLVTKSHLVLGTGTHFPLDVISYTKMVFYLTEFSARQTPVSKFYK